RPLSVTFHSVLPFEKSPLVSRLAGGGHEPPVPPSPPVPPGPCPGAWNTLAYTAAPPDACHDTMAMPFLATASCNVRTLVLVAFPVPTFPGRDQPPVEAL